jgi:hypothetical protein
MNNNYDLTDMSDLVKRLRDCEYSGYGLVCDEAADRIEELEGKLEIDTLNPNRREHLIWQEDRIKELEGAVEEWEDLNNERG